MTIQTLRPLSPTALVRATAPLLDAMHEQGVLVFASRLAHYAPALASSDMLVRTVFASLTAAAPAADRPDLSREVLVGLALHLRDAGMAPRGYIAIHAAFLDAVADRLGTDPALTSAWETATGTMLATMMAAAHGPRSHTTPLAA
ncbi:hypothetical protein [Gymnodinialimonas hymeniacidonis]|uniref:hypothetical protein n=1 Tax=Gymnodinialimonas hymeniacidonis TaxID=3126508 RepID=UPI0034C5EAE4